jgi:hypothetical protein
MLLNMAAGNNHEKEMMDFFGKLDAMNLEGTPLEMDWFVKGER